ncbi:MAG: hypothetical protein R3Y47_07805 [Lachnospiraceae bacterium]
MKKPVWMSDPCIQSIPKEKLEYLMAMFDGVKGKKQHEIMPMLMALRGKNKNSISFTKSEMELIMKAIRNASTTSEHEQMDKILAMAKAKNKNT